ncbi:MAG: fumarylacetoacetate hydrolase family protein [Gammaproteobacteria bacterium]|nr:fumarylacetoacetate hydrolase family protein [Gammaproteobacteria bacterium]
MTDLAQKNDLINEEILHQAMSVQLQKWTDVLAGGAKRVGWKLGFTPLADQQRMKLSSPVVGFLTSETVINSGGAYKANDGAKVMLEAEVAILIGRDISSGENKEQLKSAIKGFAAAIEIVDAARTPHDITSILEGNVFHEAVLIGDLNCDHPDLLVQHIDATVHVNQQLVQSGDASRYPLDFSELVSVVADTLAKQNQCIVAGEWVICGSITIPVQVFPGDRVEVSLAPLGMLRVNIK